MYIILNLIAEVKNLVILLGNIMIQFETGGLRLCQMRFYVLELEVSIWTNGNIKVNHSRNKRKEITLSLSNQSADSEL